MAQINYRGNLSAKVFPFLSSQFGRTIIGGSLDQSASFGAGNGDSAGGDYNIPQAYYMHNVMPTAQGYKSVGFNEIIPSTGISFDRVIPIRDPDMVRGWLGVTTYGRIYLYRAGDTGWTDISAQAANWHGGAISIAYANGYSYLCLSKFNVFKISVRNRTITPTQLQGLDNQGVVAITAAANYLVVTDGIKVYWSSTISPEDFVPSQITGAGSGTPEDVEGQIIALSPLGTGFAVYTSVNVVTASYSQNPRFPWIFRGVANSKGVADVQHIAAAGDDNYAWTSAGIQRISVGGALTYMPEVTDFLAGKEIEVWDSGTKGLKNIYSDTPLTVKLSFIGARFLVISHGGGGCTHALVFDTALKRWGKLKYSHVACFDVSLNTDGTVTTNLSASAKKTLGIVDLYGAVVICDFDNNTEATDSVLILGKFQVMRSRLITLDKITLESVETNHTCNVFVSTTLDGKTQSLFTVPTLTHEAPEVREYSTRVTGVNHSIIVTGTFSLNSFELACHLNGRR